MSTRDLVKILIPSIIVTLLLVIVLVIIFVPINGTLVCTNKTSTDNLNIKYTYNVKFKLRRINHITLQQKITSEDEQKLKDMALSLVEYKKASAKQKEYKYDIELDEEKIIYTVDVDYKKIKNRQSLNELKKNYEKTGAICKYK